MASTDSRSTLEILTGQVPVGAVVTVRGWVRTARVKKALAFVNVSDGATVEALQVVAKADALENFEADVSRLTAGCAVIVTGEVVESRGTQAVEMQASAIEVVGWVDDPETYPIQPKKHSFEYLREIPHLRVRTSALSAVARVRHTLSMAIHRFYDSHGFFWVHTPIVTTNDCEGAGELFRVSTLDLLRRGDGPHPDSYDDDFFGRETYLTVSGQLNVESYCQALSKVYTFGPCFRSENSNTSRHLSEFWMIEPEIAFADLDDLAKLADDFLRSLFAAVRDECGAELDFFAEHIDPEVRTRIDRYLEQSIEQMSYTDAIALLEKAVADGVSFEFPVSWGIDLQSEHEKHLTETLGRPLVVRDYPKEIKAFYMRMNDDGKTVAAMDVLAPGIGEIIGGSQREERLDVLDARMTASGIEPASMDWYRDLRRYGSVPHAGFGLGLERMLMSVSGMNNIRDVIPYPRTPKTARG